jgi:hypothetical protein
MHTQLLKKVVGVFVVRFVRRFTHPILEEQR